MTSWSVLKMNFLTQKCAWLYPTMCLSQEIIVTCPLIVDICMLMIKQSPASQSDNEPGLAVLYQRHQCGWQPNAEYHLERD